MSVGRDTRISQAVQELDRFCYIHPGRMETVETILLMDNVRVLLERYRELREELRQVKYSRNLVERALKVYEAQCETRHSHFKCRKRLYPIARLLVKSYYATN